MPIPYENASSGAAARDEILKILRRFGAESVGFMDEFETHTLLLAFTLRGRQVQLRASAQGWASMYLKEQPYTSRKRGTKAAYEQKALQQGMIAVNSILRDWVKGQITAIECGILQFEQVFLPYMLTHDGQTVAEHVIEAGIIKTLPAPSQN